jgi:AcrR family transcriptional regulator
LQERFYAIRVGAIKEKLYGTVMDAIASTRQGRDERRAAILDIALAAFLADGYAATSMSTIAQRVGGSKATLYNYFSSKEELFAAVLANKCAQLKTLLHNAQFEGGDLRAALQNFGEHFLQLLLQDESVAAYRLVIAECGRLPELGRTFYEIGVTQGLEQLAAHFERAIAAAQLKRCDASLMARYFFDLCMTGVHWLRLWNVAPFPSQEEIRSNVERAVAIFLTAFGGEKTPKVDPASLCQTP